MKKSLIIIFCGLIIVLATACTSSSTGQRGLKQTVEPIAPVDTALNISYKIVKYLNIDKRGLISVIYIDATGNEYGMDYITQKEFKAIFGFEVTNEE